MSGLKVLLTGATGYIGGSVLTGILASQSPSLSSISISVLVRGKERARVLAEKGLHVELYEDFDQTDLLENLASNYDVVIQCTHGTHAASATALIRGLGKRRGNTGGQPYYIHLSGASNVGDLPVSGQLRISHVFSDKEDIHAYERWRQSMNVYPQRTNDANVLREGLAAGVRTVIVMPPMVYGAGIGLFNRISVQVPALFSVALRRGRAVRIGDCPSTITYIHVEDLAYFYEMLLQRIVDGEPVPHDESGILFADGGEFAWPELYEGVARVLKKRGRLDSAELDILTLKEAAAELGAETENNVEAGFASNVRIRGDVAREWGWRPKKTQEDFLRSFDEEADAILEALDGDPDSVSYLKHMPKK